MGVKGIGERQERRRSENTHAQRSKEIHSAFSGKENSPERALLSVRTRERMTIHGEDKKENRSSGAGKKKIAAGTQ